MSRAWIEPSSELLFTKNDPNDPRLGEFVNATRDNAGGIHVSGYADHDGVQLNGGRIGAAEGPDDIRRQLYKMTPALGAKTPSLFDVGNISTDLTLEERHEEARQTVRNSLEKQNLVIGLGGGHDYGYSDGAGFLDHNKNSERKPLIINFDAHLDVRSLEHGLSSGTPFFRLLSDYKDFDFSEIGIQSQCNSSNHYKWVEEKGGRILPLDEITYSPNSPIVTMLNFLEPQIQKKRPTFLSIDMDGFSSAFSPGCSQVFATGLEPLSFFQLFDVLLQRLDVQVLGIYEVSPPLDVDHRTSRLAAQIAHRFIYHNSST